jgi:hypothetical protein
MPNTTIPRTVRLTTVMSPKAAVPSRCMSVSQSPIEQAEGIGLP